MTFDWNDEKYKSNLAKHGVDFAEITGFDFGAALVEASTTSSSMEPRLVAIGPIGERLYVLVYTVERGVRVISLRKANKREAGRWLSAM